LSSKSDKSSGKPSLRATTEPPEPEPKTASLFDAPLSATDHAADEEEEILAETREEEEQEEDELDQAA
jgi:hypothetical protein